MRGCGNDAEADILSAEPRVQCAFKDSMIHIICNSHYVSHFAAFFIVAGAKISVVESCLRFVSRGRLSPDPHSSSERRLCWCLVELVFRPVRRDGPTPPRVGTATPSPGPQDLSRRRRPSISDLRALHALRSECTGADPRRQGHARRPGPLLKARTGGGRLVRRLA